MFPVLCALRVCLTWRNINFIYVIFLRHFNRCATFHLPFFGCVPTIVSLALAHSKAESSRTRLQNRDIYSVCAALVRVRHIGSIAACNSRVSRINRAPAVFRPNLDGKWTKRRWEWERRKKMVRALFCGSTIINTFKRMSFCAQFIIILKEQSDATRLYLPFVVFIIRIRTETRDKRRRYDICRHRCVAGLHLSLRSTARQNYWLCCVSLWCDLCLHLPHCLFQFTPKPIPTSNAVKQKMCAMTIRTIVCSVHPSDFVADRGS